VIFKPFSGEDTVEVFDVTYKAANTLEPNTHDGKLALAIYSGEVSTGRAPDEIIMICVDKSSSMNESARFTDTDFRNSGTGKNYGANMSKVSKFLVGLIV
jgi:hypothetical protein